VLTQLVLALVAQITGGAAWRAIVFVYVLMCSLWPGGGG
jgi:hypothetical protein